MASLEAYSRGQGAYCGGGSGGGLQCGPPKGTQLIMPGVLNVYPLLFFERPPLTMLRDGLIIGDETGPSTLHAGPACSYGWPHLKDAATLQQGERALERLQHHLASKHNL